ncbi:MAG: MECDP-synthase [Agarilytica sp.]
MLFTRPFLLALCSATLLSSCGGDDQDIPDDAPINQTKVIFDPATSQVPVPSDLQFSAEAAGDGTMFAGVDPTNPVITGIDSLDGNSVLAPFDIAFDNSLNATQSLDAANFVLAGSSVVPNSAQNVFLLPLTYPSGDGLSQASIGGASVEVPTFAEAVTYQAAAAAAAEGDTDAIATLLALTDPVARAEVISIDGGTNNVLRINPLKPLQAKTKYVVIVTNDIEDGSGEPVAASEAYEFIKDPDTNLAGFGEGLAASLEPLRGAIQGWETLAAGYFGFMQAVFDSAAIDASAPSADDIVFSMTFTTGGTTDVLTHIAAPETFFETSFTAGARKDAIVKLVSGVYALDGTSTGTDPNDATIAATINAALTTEGGPLYNATVAASIAADADYATIASADASAAYLMQLAAAEVSEQVNNGDGVTLAEQAAGTVNAFAAGAGAPVNLIFPVPAARPSNFYRVDAASDISDQFPGPATIYQGDITLPYFQHIPIDLGDDEFDPTPIVVGDWEANTAIGDIIDAANSNPEDTTPPSDRVTYRYPFPSQQANVTIPILAVTPDEALVTKPAEGWPVIIFAHGITSERSANLLLANSLASACITAPGTSCFASVSIDQPLHGVAAEGAKFPGSVVSVDDPNNPITPNVGNNVPDDDLTERHFNFTADAALNPIPMDYDTGLGASGAFAVNLSSFTTARDNLRQYAIDLLNVNASLATMDLDDDGNPDFDINNVHFVGISLGGIDGIPFVAINNSDAVQNSLFSTQPFVKTAAALNAGGGAVRLLTNSPSFAPSILGGLAAASDELVQGRSGLETYLSVFQGVLDSIDVMNFANLLSDESSTTGVYLTEIVGGGDNLPDQTIPNGADSVWGTEPLFLEVSSTLTIDGFPAPLAGTEPMLAQFDPESTGDIAGDDGDAAVVVSRFTEGTHGTPGSGDNPAVFAEVVAQLFTFLNSDGDVSGSIVTNTDVIE